MMGHAVSQRTVCDRLMQLNCSLQFRRKTRDGSHNPDRDAQFHHIAKAVAGREWRPRDEPEQVRVHDFIDTELGKVSPYGVYDVTANEGWVSVGINHDTAEFAVQSTRR